MKQKQVGLNFEFLFFSIVEQHLRPGSFCRWYGYLYTCVHLSGVKMSLISVFVKFSQISNSFLCSKSSNLVIYVLY